ncbi:MAG: hypothetical protein P4K98_00980 [Bryobacteraceae bacterium]|nr:hypothetical protein [Bryobacteraceae bacterium]
MRVLFTISALLLSLFALAAWCGGAPNSSDPVQPFRPAPAAAWPSHQSVGEVTFAAVRYESDADTHPVFGKVNPNEHGVLPVLLIIENKGNQNLLLDQMKIQFMAPGGIRLDPTPAKDLPYLIGPKRPGPSYPVPIPLPKRKNKNALAEVAIDSRAWGAKNVLPGESAHGFFYFQTEWRRNSYVYISGIREGRSLKELFFAEVPMDNPGDAKEVEPAAEQH